MSVRARERDADLAEWMKKVLGLAIGQRHMLLRPNCTATRITVIKIPLDKDDKDGWVGKQTDFIPPEDKT